VSRVEAYVLIHGVNWIELPGHVNRKCYVCLSAVVDTISIAIANTNWHQHIHLDLNCVSSNV
jgi:hypothetical protein